MLYLGETGPGVCTRRSDCVVAVLLINFWGSDVERRERLVAAVQTFVHRTGHTRARRDGVSQDDLLHRLWSGVVFLLLPELTHHRQGRSPVPLGPSVQLLPCLLGPVVPAEPIFLAYAKCVCIGENDSTLNGVNLKECVICL